MRQFAVYEALACWAVMVWPLVFRAPHNQKRASITAITPTRAGLALEMAAFFLAWRFALPAASPPGVARLACAMVAAPLGAILFWTAIPHLGRQFRIHAGLYEDHELVRTGPYGFVRHPIYAALLLMLVNTLLIHTRWPWWAISVALFVVGTEIRVRTEDKLLESRFGDEFRDYRARVAAYLPLLR